MSVFSVEQRAFIEHAGDVFLVACPGAGKTKTIIHRIERLLSNLPPKRGVAVLSFTNSAVDEIKSRCNELGLKRATLRPSVVSTFDSFLTRFLFYPLFDEDLEQKPNIVDSWRTYGIEVRLSGQNAFRGDGLGLDLFDEFGRIKDPTTIGNAALRKHFIEHRGKYESQALRSLQGLRRSGHFTIYDVRREIIRLLKDVDNRKEVSAILSRRFKELIVDEAQDCNELDIEIIRLLQSSGISVSIVCDPNQAIYSFRSNSSDEVPIKGFLEAHDPSKVLTFTGNFRSSEIICKTAALQKSIGGPDTPTGENSEVDIPIYLIVFHGRSVPASVGTKFSDLVKECKLTIPESIVLSHRRADAYRAVGDTVFISGTARIAILAKAVSEYHLEMVNSKRLMNAVETVEHMVFEYVMGDSFDRLDYQKFIQGEESARSDLRRLAIHVLDTLEPQCDWEQFSLERWIQDARDCFSDLPPPPESGKSVKQYLRKPNNDDWAKVFKRHKRPELKAATVHEAKGKEFDAVCIILRPGTSANVDTGELLGSLGEETDSESKRVLYVGTTRSKKLLAYGLHEKHLDQMIEILSANSIPHEVIKAD